MSLKIRTIAIVTGAAAATALAGAAALASPASEAGAGHMGGQVPAHMAEMDADTMAEMNTMMAGDGTVGEMHQWMRDQDISIGQMHRYMVGQGMNLGQMHGSMAATKR